MNATGQSAIFGRRKEPHTVIIARGSEIRHFTIRPWLVVFLGSALAAIAIGYLLATSYLVLRDDLIGATTARQARMQQAYEDRISALRAQVDRITSRQLLDQQLMETKVSELLERQTQLSQRHGRLGPLLDRAENEVGAATAEDPAAPAKPDKHAEVTGSIAQPAQSYALASLGAATGTADTRPFSLWATRSDPLPNDSAADRADKLFISINKSLKSIENDQLTRISILADNAYKNADAITQALEAAGLPVDSDFGKNESDVGGPLIPLDSSMFFDSKVKELDEALDTLDQLKKEARRLPLANPAPGHSVTSPFGVRTDPILGTAALHSGMDFRAPIGMAAKVTAPGVVTKAGWNGGYGRMVEVDHGNGFATRYGHLSEIDVTVGEKVDAGAVIGKTGSSGRSTGPHLHYEVRHNGEAIDPLRFLTVGKKVAQYL
ncbi:MULTISPECIES: M23 family metallopeptidase [unclassified Mesorhizobium]|uniref:M23 family metallopeptidase n=1 Tax=unclassified Mesorhizobium TaxID=325217 RepID=UPI001128C5C0|nr:MULTISPECIES: M23 family metallopeptidase [unclassified Mesorhizobium]TPJ37596.1 M23 family peptidase [Mesorhizobium sp. B2-6-6]MBZ9704880.1 peptidoglycan DD-metalloendopeptidase family protein [Mesorhizobium sp. CO1-1-3]MBZ9950524.1 peptidoglycan DD-metalloendopeptidase family protein [Mesorhizobium sp. BR1-1-11]MBZ9998724.1 peptidoglycan DD-metalloendopeptidase family protein [Mesorhizobium sp. B264B2A]MCA0005269.1 peptidoglycan DD-metalloendopeptidase family protein [Mesorhizobium sp. B2